MTASLSAVAALAAAALLAQATPQQELLRSLGLPDVPGRAVVDEARVLSPATRSALEELLARHQAQSSNQVVVVTLPSLRGADIADVGYALGQTWRVGQAGRDNGVVLLIAVQERKSRVEVGKGLEGALTDLESRIILDEVVKPFLAQGRFDEGLFRGAQAVLKAVEGEYTGTGQRGGQGVPIPPWVVLVGVVLLGLLFLVSPEAGMLVLWTLASGGRGGGGRGGGGFSGGGGRFGGGGASGDW